MRSSRIQVPESKFRTPALRGLCWRSHLAAEIPPDDLVDEALGGRSQIPIINVLRFRDGKIVCTPLVPVRRPLPRNARLWLYSAGKFNRWSNSPQRGSA